MLERYIKIEWPDTQKFQEIPEYEDECYEYELVTFVPEWLYIKVMNDNR